MPIYVGYTQKRRRVKILNAGVEQILLCPETDIFLNAVVNDETNFQNHTLLWEQISGSSVVLSSTNTLATSYVFGDSEDKTFRFWLDKGTNEEQYADINILYTPTSKWKTNVMSGVKNNISVTVPNLVQSSFPIAPHSAEPGLVNFTPGTIFQFDKTSEAGLGASIHRLEILSDPGYVTNPETVYESYEPDEIPDRFALPNGVYIVRVYYELNKRIFYYDSPLLVSNTFFDPPPILVDSQYTGMGVRSASSVSRESIEIFVADPSIFPPMSLSAKSGFGASIRYTNLRKDYLDIPELQDSVYFQGMFSRLGTVTRLDPSNIGSN